MEREPRCSLGWVIRATGEGDGESFVWGLWGRHCPGSVAISKHTAYAFFFGEDEGTHTVTDTDTKYEFKSFSSCWLLVPGRLPRASA
eukprot:scaffold9957_cov107-Isochrysis_galbana.AAC.1